MRSIFRFAVMLPLFVACSQSGKDSAAKESPAPGLGNSQSLQIYAIPEVGEPVKANTPPAYRGGFEVQTAPGLAPNNPTEYCNTQNNPETETAKWNACRAAAEVKERFFSGSGPSDVATLVESIDSYLSSAFANTGSSYMPCFDANNTAGGTFQIQENGATVTKTYPAYKLTKVSGMITPPASYGSGAPSAFEAGWDGYYSCMSTTPEVKAGGEIWRAFGRKDGAYYLQDGQTRGMGSMARVEVNGDVELYFAVADAKGAISSWGDEVDNSKMSLGVVHLKSFSSSGLLEFTSTGSGLGYDCGLHFVTNGSLLFIRFNENKYGACFPNDSGIGEVSKVKEGVARNYEAASADQTACLDVSTATIKGLASAQGCRDQGLTVATFVLTDLNRATFRGHQAAGLFAKPTVETVTYVPVSNNAPVESKDRNEVVFAIAAETDNKIDGATCNETTGNALTLSYKFDYGAYLKERLAANKKANANAAASDLSAPPYDEAQDRDRLLNAFKEGIAISAPTITYTVSASAAATKWAAFSMAVTAALDGKSVATASYAETSDHTIGAQAKSLIVDLSKITGSSVLTISASGTLRLGCTATNGTGSAAVKLAVPRLQWREVFNGNVTP